jgi:hypothetical protein
MISIVPTAVLRSVPGRWARQKNGQDAQISKVKADLETWIDEHYQDHSLNVVVMSALLEVAFERFIDLHGEKDALELIESRFRRTAKITRPTLQ